MACISEIVCLGEFCSCNSNIELPIAASETGTFMLVAIFNDVRITRNINIIEGQNILIPNIFNENYLHEIYFSSSSGEILDDTHYSIKTVFCLNNNNGMPTDGLISIVAIAESGNVLIDDRMIGRIVTAYIINDISKNTEFSKPLNSNTLTLLGDNLFDDNSIVTVIFE